MTLFKYLSKIKQSIICFTQPYSVYVYKFRNSTKNRALVLIDYQDAACDEASA